VCVCKSCCVHAIIICLSSICQAATESKQQNSAATAADRFKSKHTLAI